MDDSTNLLGRLQLLEGTPPEGFTHGEYDMFQDLEKGCLEEIREADEKKEATYVFMGGRWFCTINKCITFLELHVPEYQFQWFLYRITYL